MARGTLLAIERPEEAMRRHGTPALEPGDGSAVRERLERRGAAALRDEELLAVLLSAPGTPAAAEVQRALGWLASSGGLYAVAEALRHPGSPLPGTRPPRGAARARLAAAFELGRRSQPNACRLAPAIRTPEDVAREVRDLAYERREHLVGLGLDAASRLLARETVAIGSLNVARALPRDLLEPPLRLGATALVIVHNHPSGDPEPSDDDVRFTQAVGRGAALLGLVLADHVVIASGGFVSLRARGARWEGMAPPPA